MGWLWGSNEAKPKPKPSNSNTDPLRDLDPSLRDFLETESPSAQKPPPSSPSSPQPPSEPPPNSDLPTLNNASPDIPSSSKSTPPPMVYSDGRYADLWSSYRPLGAIEEETKSDQEKLSDVLEGYKERKALIGRAALENCALENTEWNDCLKSGGWIKKMSLCRAENKAFERCYVMQARFLKALGYLSSPRPGLVEEQIQMHADTLYHRMLAQEAAIAAAKASNTPIPTFPPIMTSSSSPGNSSVALVSPSTSSERTPPLTTTTTDPTTPSSSTSSPAQQKQEQEQPPPPYLPARPFEQFSKDHLTPSAREALQKRLKDLPDEERELEERALAMEASQSDAVGRTLGKILSESERKRKERRETGEAGVGDWIAWLFGR